MADPQVFFDLKTKKVTRTVPPGLIKLLHHVEGSTLVAVPYSVFDTAKDFMGVPVQIRRETRKPK